MSKERKLGEFLKEVGNWSWEEFARAEQDDRYSTAESVIFSLIRACALQKVDAIKLAINRVDGKLSTPVRVIYPKLYYIYPRATEVALAEPSPSLEQIETTQVTVDTQYETPAGEIVLNEEGEPVEESDLPTLGFRETIDKMVDYPRSVPNNVVEAAQKTDRWVHDPTHNPRPRQVPMVKAVVAAHILQMAQRRDLEALYEVFDSIDGKLVETLQVVGEDIYITQFSTIAPAGAIKNADGVYQIEAKEPERLWTEKLGGKLHE